MDAIGFVIFIGTLIAHLIEVPMDGTTFIGVCIGLGLCAIAGAINNLKGWRK